jgi:sugar lactone lactonase YvrE
VANRQSPQVRKIVASTPGQPNGIFYEKGKNRLVFVNWGNNAPISAVDLGDSKVTTVKATDRGNCDGITRDRTGNWYISCWVPQPGVYKLAPDFSGSPVAMSSGSTRPRNDAMTGPWA